MHEDLKKLNQGACPDCDGNRWKTSGWAGIALDKGIGDTQTIECLGCGSKFKVTRQKEKIIFKERL